MHYTNLINSLCHILFKVIGWIMRGFFGQPDNTHLAEIDLDESISLRYDEDTKSANCTSSIVWMWLALCENAGLSTSLISREAAAISLHASGVLLWSVRNSIAHVFSSRNKLSDEENEKTGGGNLAVRVWALVLRLMQVSAMIMYYILVIFIIINYIYYAG